MKNNKIKNFLRVGVIGLLIATNISSALAQPINQITENQLTNQQIVNVIRTSTEKSDLDYFIQSGSGVSNEKIEKIQNHINASIQKVLGNKKINQIKDEINKAVKPLNPNDEFKINYSWAMPREILQEYKDTKQTDSSVANGSFDISQKCEVNVKLAVDNVGRLFESSELVSNTVEEITLQTNEQLFLTLKETVAHELSHCIVHKHMKSKNFELNFSNKFKENNPEIVKSFNKIINNVKDKIASQKHDEINKLDYVIFSNYQENFADVYGAFGRLGENPNAEKINEVKLSLINLAQLRENSRITHQTKGAYQYALDNLEVSAKMSLTEREDFAKQIASDALIMSAELMTKKLFQNSGIEEIAYLLTSSIELKEGGKVNISTDYVKEKSIDLIVEEYVNILENKENIGMFNKKIETYNEIIQKHQFNPSVLKRLKQTNEQEASKKYTIK